MKPRLLLHLFTGLLLAVVLLFLFLKSQVDERRLHNTSISLLSLVEYDQELKLQMIELKNGYHKNYGGLVVLQTNIEHQLDHLTKTNEAGLLAPESVKRLGNLKNLFRIRLETAEHFKRKNALIRNALLFFPKAIANLKQDILTSEELSPSIQTDMENRLNELNSMMFMFHSQVEADIDRVNFEVEIFREYFESELPLQFHSNLNIIITNARHILNYPYRSSQSLKSPGTIELARRMLQYENAHFLTLEKNALTYRYLLFAVSMLILFYLLFVFLKLQKATESLKKSLHELEFHKDAIDEHSIVSITDAEGKILYANDKFCDITQYSRDEIIGKSHNMINSGIHDKDFYGNLWKTIRSGKIWHGIFANQARDGSIHWVESTILPRLNEQGKPYQFIGIRTDITAQKIAEEQSRLLARFPAESPDPVMRLDREGRLIYANASSQTILDHWKISLGEHLPQAWLAISHRVLLANNREDHELVIDDRHYSILFTPIPEADYVNVYGSNITKVKQAERDLSHQATHDPLTGLKNRVAFERALEVALKGAQQEGRHGILLYIDLDQFKIVNDTCGHVAGDELLRQIGHKFQDLIRDSDTLARLGGDEFGIILNNCGEDHGERISNKILYTLDQFRFLWGDKSFEIGASIGLVDITSDSDSGINLLGQADIACYAAKDKGRNRLQIYQTDSEFEQRRDEMRWASLIPRALAENRFELYAQLIKPLKADAGDKPHYEMLIRLNPESGETVPPGAFIPAAERYGLMHTLDIWVISEAIERIGHFNAENPRNPIHIAINLSGATLGNRSVASFISDQMERSLLDPRFITFEITETCAISNLTAAIQFITEMKKLGCYFSLDDFGSGLSSFSYLKNLPVDYLKIDGSFVRDILEDPIDEAMVRSINQIGHVMNIKTIAEFVESSEIEDRLVDMDIDFVQGFGIERPRPLSELLNDKKRPLQLKVSN